MTTPATIDSADTREQTIRRGVEEYNATRPAWDAPATVRTYTYSKGN